MKILLTILIILFTYQGLYSQENTDYVLWSSSDKLTVNDFSIKRSNSISGSSFAQFSMNYSVTGFDFMTKNFNKKVKCTMLRSASWIDTTQNTELSLRYQQTLFDLLEIYTRRFRKELKENRKQIASGLNIVQEIDQRNSTGFAQRRLQYDTETNTGSIIDKQIIWEEQIKKELEQLSDYDFNKY